MYNKSLPKTEDYDVRRIDLKNFQDQDHSKEDIDLLFRIYMDKRLESQVGFYKSRIRENELNSDFTFVFGAGIMTLSSLIATLSAGGNYPLLSLIAALLPAVAALLASFRQLYGWDQQITIYRDSNLGLQRARLLAPDDDQLEKADLMQLFPQLVVATEEVFTSEVSQWGQFIAEKDKSIESGDTIAEFKQLFAPTMVDGEGNLRLTDAQLNAIQSILAAAVPTGEGAVAIERDTVRQITSSVEVAAVQVDDAEVAPVADDEANVAPVDESASEAASASGESSADAESSDENEPVG
ncbi:MAG: SLATT domain-containing protein [Anaerolineaceae bacterium]|nr:SLATT domain-containing protein [Anaerolineaceae bacterium]